MKIKMQKQNLDLEKIKQSDKRLETPNINVKTHSDNILNQVPGTKYEAKEFIFY